MTTWHGPTEPDAPKIGALGWLRVVARGLPLAIWIFGGLALLLLCRVFERPFFGFHRPVTPRITQGVCRVAIVILGIGWQRRGTPLRGMGAIVANHASWLDIFALNAAVPLYFVAKSEVANWPGIGWLARATGTVFIRRNPRAAAAQRQVFEDRLRARHRLLFFPEGTSTDGKQVLPFKSTLFEAFFMPEIRDRMAVQPVSLAYTAPDAAAPAFYGWWGDMGFGPHLLKVLAAPRQGSVTVTFHPSVAVADAANRKALAKACESAVRSALPLE